MEESDISVIKKGFSRFISRFGENHAKIYRCLLSREPKSGKQIMGETEIANEQQVYNILKDLLEHRLIAKNHTRPALYYVENPVATYRCMVRREIKEIEESVNVVSRICQNAGSEGGSILAKPKEGRIIFNNKAVTKEHEIVAVKQEVDRLCDRLMDEAREREMKPWMVAGRVRYGRR